MFCILRLLKMVTYLTTNSASNVYNRCIIITSKGNLTLPDKKLSPKRKPRKKGLAFVVISYVKFDRPSHGLATRGPRNIHVTGSHTVIFPPPPPPKTKTCTCYPLTHDTASTATTDPAFGAVHSECAGDWCT